LRSYLIVVIVPVTAMFTLTKDPTCIKRTYVTEMSFFWLTKLSL